MRLAIVEDMGDLAALYQVLLSNHDVAVVFSSALAAKAWTGWDTVDAVVTDQRLGKDMTGSDLLAWLAQDHPDVRRVLVSAYSPSEEAKSHAHVYADKSDFVDDVDAVLDQL